MPLLQLIQPIHPAVEDEDEVASTAFEDAVEARSEREAPLVVDEVHPLLQNHGTPPSIKVRQIQHLSVIGTRIPPLMASRAVPLNLPKQTMRR